jgi:DUF177 domain-containing protein
MIFDMERRKIYHARLMYARPFINSPDFARNGWEISGEVQLVELTRLQDILENPQGTLSYTVQGGVEKHGNHFLDVRAAGLCRLRCQRCLNGLDYPVLLDTRLLLRDQASLDALDDNTAGSEEGERDSILADAHLNVLDLLEEEILLSLPIAPKHELGACQATDDESTRMEEKNPFAVLAELRRI